MTGNSCIIRKDDNGRTTNQMDDFRNLTRACDVPNRRQITNLNLQSQDKCPDISLFSKSSTATDNNHA